MVSFFFPSPTFPIGIDLDAKTRTQVWKSSSRRIVPPLVPAKPGLVDRQVRSVSWLIMSKVANRTRPVSLEDSLHFVKAFKCVSQLSLCDCFPSGPDKTDALGKKLAEFIW